MMIKQSNLVALLHIETVICFVLSSLAWVIYSFCFNNTQLMPFLSRATIGLDGAQWVVLFFISLSFGYSYIKDRAGRNLICCLSLLFYLLISIIYLLVAPLPMRTVVMIGSFLPINRNTILTIVMGLFLSLYPLVLSVKRLGNNMLLFIILAGVGLYWFLINMVLTQILLRLGVNSYFMNAIKDFLDAICFGVCGLSVYLDQARNT